MHAKHQEAVNLRLQGNSYGMIAKKLRVSKSSVSNWCKNLELPIFAQKIIEDKNKHIREKFKLYNQQKHQFVQNENRVIIEKAIKQISKLSKRDLLLIGISLYWAEGYKKQNSSKTPQLDVANSDPALIVIFLRFLREILKISEDKLRPKIFLHPNINKNKTIAFWSHVTKIPRKCFATNILISRAGQGKRPINSLPYGTLDLRVNGRKEFFQVKGWIDGLIKQNSR